MNSIAPNDEALRTHASNPYEGIIVELHMLKFKYEGGSEAYDRYVKSVSQILDAHGARSLYR